MVTEAPCSSRRGLPPQLEALEEPVLTTRRRIPLSRKPSKFVRRSMQRLRQSFRESFRRSGSKDRGLGGPASASSGPRSGEPKPQQWHQDEATVRAGTCNFFVKYLGCVEVFESRGMQVCEEALKVLRAQRRRPVKAVLYVSGDGLRVVDAENKGLIVDQTIEKETGERLSHAVGCAFAVCLEKKQKRDRDAATASQLAAMATTSSSSHALVSSASLDSTPAKATAVAPGTNGPALFDSASLPPTSFSRSGSARQASLTERLADPQTAKPAQPPPALSQPAPLPPTALARPAPNPQLFTRNGSLRGPSTTGNAFRRHQSLRMGDLPSTLLRQGQMGIPGARVSAIPEEGFGGQAQASPSGTDLSSLYATPIKSLSNHSNESSPRLASQTSAPSTSRSKAEMWLESALQSGTSSSSLGRSGPTSPRDGVDGMSSHPDGGGPASSPPPGTPPSLPPRPRQSPHPPATPSSGVLGEDIFGQPAFLPPAPIPTLPPRPPRLSPAARSATLDSATTGHPTSPASNDPFEAKWAELGTNPSTPNPPPAAAPTNPFRTQSSAVDI